MRRFLVVLCLLVASAGALADSGAPVLLVWGDSLSSAYGLPLESGWVALLQERLRTQGYPYHVVNGSVTGETTAGGLARLPDALDRHHPALVLIELGGNDGLRGLPVAQMRANLAAMAQASKRAGARVAIFEMRMPPNYGAYAEEFRKAFADVARAEHAALVPFFLEKIASDPKAFQDDGIHPALASQPILLDAAWSHLQPLLKKARATTAPASKAPARP